MIIVKLNKSGASAYISHIDFMRSTMRALNRAKIPVAYSLGFNPHMNIFFSSPISVGIESGCEYACIESETDAREFLDKYNRVAAPGQEARAAVNRTDNPNLMAITGAAKYLFELSENVPLCLPAGGEFFVRNPKKPEELKEVSKRILQVSQEGSVLTAILTAGNDNLRPDVFINAVLEGRNTECKRIRKAALYIRRDGKLTDFDEYLGIINS